MNQGKLNFCGKVLEVFQDRLSGQALKNALNLDRDRTLVKKQPNGINTIIRDDEIVQIPNNPDDLYLDDLPTLREGVR